MIKIVSIFILLYSIIFGEGRELDESTIRLVDSVIHIAVEEYPPYTSKKLKYNGLDCRIITEAFQYENIQVEFHFYPGARAYLLAQNGKMHGTVPWAKREDRNNFFYYSLPIRKADREFLFYHADSTISWEPSFENYSSLKGLRIGAILGYNYGDKFESAEKEKVINVDRVPQLIQNFKKLQRGNIDIIISQYRIAKHTMNAQLTKEEINKIAWIPENNDTSEHDYLLISKAVDNGEELIKTFNKGLLKLKKSGRLELFIKELDTEGYQLLQ